MSAFLSKLKRRLSRECPRCEVKFDGDGFSVLEEEKKSSRVRWSEVLEVFAYKMDLFTVDEICIGFRVDAAGAYCWVSEEFTGYRELLDEIKKRFPGIREDWFSTVAFPAFVENRTTLWGEACSPQKKEPNQAPEPTAPSGRGSS